MQVKFEESGTQVWQESSKGDAIWNPLNDNEDLDRLVYHSETLSSDLGSRDFSFGVFLGFNRNIYYQSSSDPELNKQIHEIVETSLDGYRRISEAVPHLPCTHEIIDKTREVADKLDELVELGLVSYLKDKDMKYWHGYNVTISTSSSSHRITVPFDEQAESTILSLKKFMQSAVEESYAGLPEGEYRELESSISRIYDETEVSPFGNDDERDEAFRKAGEDAKSRLQQVDFQCLEACERALDGRIQEYCSSQGIEIVSSSQDRIEMVTHMFTQKYIGKLWTGSFLD